jgi:sec-independent protein translocase protein TatA
MRGSLPCPAFAAIGVSADCARGKSPLGRVPDTDSRATGAAYARRTMLSGLENPFHLLLLLLLLLLLFGARRLPEMGRSLGTGMREFKDSLTGTKPSSIPPAVSPAPESENKGTS